MSLPEILPSDLPTFTRKTSRSNFINSVVPVGSVLLFAQSDSNSGIRLMSKNSDGSYSNVKSGIDVQLGQIVEVNGIQKFIPIIFDGVEASAGQSQSFSQLYTYNTVNPVPGPSGSSMNFYKCASVDISNSIWTGYQAIIDSVTGIWSWANTVTTGLTYDRFIPSVTGVYAGETCIFMVSKINTGIPDNGLVFYASLNGDTPSTAESGQTINASGTVTYDIIDLVPCAYFSNNSFCYVDGNDLPYGSSDRTVSFWIHPTENVTDKYSFFYGSRSNNSAFGCRVDSSSISVITWGTDLQVPVNTVNTWNNIIFVVSDYYIYVYINGTLAGSIQQPNINTSYNSTLYIGRRDSDTPFTGYISSLRIYNRALTSSEITALANEFILIPAS